MTEEGAQQEQDLESTISEEGREPEEQNEGLAAKPEEEPVAFVGIGASAGGLEALEQFFWHMPAENGMAFVVIQHQDPAQPSLLPEILQRFTKMPVESIDKDGLKARPNTVYVKPPDYDLSILQGNFALLKPTATVGGRMGIDQFFRHLAEDQDGKAVGIVLSGMGSDGTLGIRAIKEHTGMVMAEEPTSASFDAMPQSAIATGLVDYIAPPESLPQLLVDYVQASSELKVRRVPATPAVESALARIFILIRTRTGKDFSMYKRSTVMRRIERRMGLHQLAHLSDYIRYLQENPQEVEVLAKEMLIGVTQFFRDPDAWKTLQENTLPKLIGSKPEGSTLRIWIVGCSTGEEAYSMAMVLFEALEGLGRSGDVRFQIFATDVESESIEIARTGLYPANIEADVSAQRLERFFIKENGNYRVTKQLRETVVFAIQNVIRDPPFTHLDILSCRNLLIYLTPELQKKLILLFNFALEPEGILFLGEAESVGKDDLFTTLDRTWKIFQRRYGSTEEALHEIPLVFETPAYAHGRRPPDLKESSIISLAQGRLLDRYAPPAVIVTLDGDIQYVHGRTGNYLEPSQGKANLNVVSMAREGLRYSVTSALRKAAEEDREVCEKNVFVRTNGSSKRISLTVQPIHRTAGMQDLFLVAFEEMPELELESAETALKTEPKGPRDVSVEELKQELRDARAELQHMMEEKQASQEELTSMNEELQSANEELQSTNEELTSSKEELQSINEEIQTMNAELQSKIEALSQSHDDMRNLLQSADIPMVFLDGDLKVRRFTDAIKPIVTLRSSDIGRPVSELKLNLVDEDIVRDAQDVLNTLQFKERRVQTEDGMCYKLRLMPYRTSDNKINGITVTFLDVTDLKELEQSLKDARDFAESIVATVREPLLVLDSDLRVVKANQSFYKTFETKPQKTDRRLLYTLGDSQWDIPELRRLLEEILPKNTTFENFEVTHDFPQIGKRSMLLNARKIQSQTGQDLILLAIEDITGKPATGGGKSREDG
ncbi:MAG: chemotaxis protein CheB [Methanotrichaceae archaeon]|nr:chemotaxis protein CheB [Methanotrichaceae archaeon]